MSQPTIHQLCSAGRLEEIRNVLSQNPEKVNEDDQYDWLPLFHAALGKHFEVVKLLIDHGADLSLHDGYVMHYAAEVAGNKEVVALLIQHGALHAHVKPIHELQHQFLIAIFLAELPRVNALLDQSPDLIHLRDGRGDQALHHACRNGDQDLVELLLRSGAQVNAKGAGGNTSLYCAGGHGHVSVVKCLIDAGVDLHAPISDAKMNMKDWLAQYPDDARFKAVAKLLAEAQ